MNNTIKQFGKGVRSWRRLRGMSQIGLSKQTGISQGVISRIEQGKREAGLSKCLAISEALRIDVNHLALGATVTAGELRKKTKKPSKVLLKALRNAIDI